MYTKDWAIEQSKILGTTVKEDEKTVNLLLQGLEKKGGHCPCVPQHACNKDTICPCKPMRETGHCKCGLFENITK